MSTILANKITGRDAGRPRRSLQVFFDIVRPLASITFAMLTAAFAGCASRSADYRALVAQVRNEHVTWDGSYIGL